MMGTRTASWILPVALVLGGLACDPGKEAAQEKDKDKGQNPPAVSPAETAAAHALTSAR